MSVPESKPQIDIESIAEVPREAVPSVADTKAEEETLEFQKEQQKALLKGLTQDIDERKKYAHRIYCLVIAWIAALGIIILLQGFRMFGFQLTPGVLTAIVTSTTASIVGIFLIVATYLFPKR